MDCSSKPDNLSMAGAGVTAGTSNAETEVHKCNPHELIEIRVKDKARRYWTTREEDHLYEIWGRDNWRLTRNGKNTIYFGQWSEELKDRFDVYVKPEEIQMKVNQTRAKFRQVKKNQKNNPTNMAARWKKFDIIDRILKNQYRPKDAEPLPPEVLQNNRDMSPEPVLCDQQLNLADDQNNSYFNANNVNNSNTPCTELFADQYDEVKQEYEDDYRSIPIPEQMQSYSPAESAQLTELQTPQQIQHQIQSSYDQRIESYGQPIYNNSSNQAITAVAYINNTNNSISVSSTNNEEKPVLHQATINANNTQINTSATMSSSTPAPRKRGRPFGSSAAPASDSLEAIFIEEVRRKNQILSEQTEISRQRLELEERKVTLLTSFFPKCLEQQANILAQFEYLTKQQNHHQEQH